MTPTVMWQNIGDDGVRAVYDQGDFTGAKVTTAQVVLGGNGRWTPWVVQVEKGRLRKLGKGRIAGKTVSCYWPGQVQTRKDAVNLCEAFLKTLGNWRK